MCQKFLPKIIKEIKEFLLLMEKFVVQFQEFQKRFFLSNMSKGAKPTNIKLTKRK